MRCSPLFSHSVCLFVFSGPALAHHGGCGLRLGPSAHHDGDREGISIHPAAPAHHSGSEGRPGRHHRMVRGNDRAESFGSLWLEWAQTKTGGPDHRGRPPFQKWFESFESPENLLGERRSDSSGPASGTRPADRSSRACDIATGSRFRSGFASGAACSAKG